MQSQDLEALFPISEVSYLNNITVIEEKLPVSLAACELGQLAV
jgi:hypothetical protein